MGTFGVRIRFFDTPAEPSLGLACGLVPGGRYPDLRGEVSVETIRLVDVAGQACQFWAQAGMGHPTAVRSITIPAGWGGTLFVTFRLTAFSSPLNQPVTLFGSELATAVFPLSGTASGCSTFRP